MVAPRTDKHRYSVLAMLFIAYLFNFLDRQLIGILAVPIQKELALTDAQLGLMGGMAFALFYALLGVPAGWLADRCGRARVIGWSLALWSLCTAACGAAQGFISLLIARMGVGVGEAGGVAPSYALITQYFGPQSRGRALALYAMAIPIGSALAMWLGGALASAWGWRMAFVAMGVAGLAFAPFFFWVVRDTRAPMPSAPVDMRASLKLLLRQPSFWGLSVGAGLGSLIGYGMMFWLPSLFARRYGLSLPETGQYMALLFLCGGLLGLGAGGWLADKLGRKHRAAYALLPAAAYLLCVPLYLLGLVAPSPQTALLWLIVPQALSLLWMAPVTTAVQQLAPPHARSMASALFLLINNLIGLGLGSWVLGALSDHFGRGGGGAGLLQALQWGLGFYLLAALAMLWAARHIGRDWQDAA